jgi:hypothetical protein
VESGEDENLTLDMLRGKVIFPIRPMTQSTFGGLIS